MKINRVVPAALVGLLLSGMAVAPASATDLREVHGSMRTEDGVPYANSAWRVRAVDGSWTDQGRIDGDGNFTFWAPRGVDVEFWAGPGTEIEDPAYGSYFCTGADSWADDGTGITVAGEQQRLDIRTPRARNMTVVVQDAQGQPVSNVEVLPDSWATKSGRLDLGHNYRPCQDYYGYITPEAPLVGYPGASYVNGWLPGGMGGVTDSDGRAHLSTPGDLTGNLAVVRVRMRPGEGEQTLGVPASSLQGSDPYNQTVVVTLPQVPIAQPASTMPEKGKATVRMATPSGAPVKDVRMKLVPVDGSGTEGSVVAEATTGADGKATFTNVTKAGKYRAKATNVSARTVDVDVAAVPTASVSVKSVSHGSKMYVNVNPNKGSGYWRFKVQYKDKHGQWQTKSTTYKTSGSGETRTLNFGKGTYRVVVEDKYGYKGSTSAEVHLRK